MLPDLGKDLKIPEYSWQWVLSAFALSSVSCFIIIPYSRLIVTLQRAAFFFSVGDSQIYTVESLSFSSALHGWAFSHSDVALHGPQANCSFSEASKVSAAQQLFLLLYVF